MSRKGFPAAIWLWVLLGMLFGPWGGRAWAAPPVQRLSRPPMNNPYPEAADELGFRDWGGAASATPSTRVTVRLDAERLALSVELPPNTPLPTAEAWLQGLSDAMGWQDVILRSNAQPEALYLRAEVRQVVQKHGFGRSAARFNAALLTAELRKLSSRAVPLGIRLVGAELERASTPPVKGGRSGNDTFLFYYLNDFNPAEGSLALDYGLPRRWLAAGAAGLLLWLFFPPLALHAVRAYLCGQPETEARQRLLLYRRWQRGVLVVPTVLALGTLFLGRFWFLGYFGTSFAFATPMLIFLPSAAFGLAARLIGLPLERAAWPQRAKLAWYRMASTELWLAGTVVVVIGGTGLAMSSSIQSGRSPSAPGTYVLPFLIPIAIAVGATAWTAVVNFRRKKGALPNELEAPVELTAAVQELTTRLGVPVERLRVAPPREGLLAGNVMVIGSLAVLGREVSDSLAPEQVAALVAAEALALPRSRADRLLAHGLGFMGLLFCVVVLSGMWFRPGSLSGLSPRLPFYLAVGPLMMVLTTVNQRRTEKRRETADLRAAEALPDPLGMLLAFKKLEEVQIETAGLDLASARQSNLTQRRERLARRLGLE